MGKQAASARSLYTYKYICMLYICVDAHMRICVFAYIHKMCGLYLCKCVFIFVLYLCQCICM